jgi:hypothetical protein
VFIGIALLLAVILRQGVVGTCFFAKRQQRQGVLIVLHCSFAPSRGDTVARHFGVLCSFGNAIRRRDVFGYMLFRVAIQW